MKLLEIPFRARHVPLVKPDADAEMMRMALLAERESDAYTLCLLGDPVACGGIWVQGESAQIWGLFSPLAKRFPKQLFSCVKRRLDRVAQTATFSRYYATMPTTEESARFLAHLGFRRGEELYIREVKPCRG